MFNATKILNTIQKYLDEQILTNAPLCGLDNPKGWPHIHVTLDVYKTYSAEDFHPNQDDPYDVHAFVGILPNQDVPVESEDFPIGHMRTLTVSFGIMAIGFPPQTYIEPIVNLICVLLSRESNKLNSGDSVFQAIISDIGQPTVSYEAVSGEKEFSKGIVDIPITYFASTKSLPTSYLS